MAGVAASSPSGPELVVLAGGRNQRTLIAVPKGDIEEAQIELIVSRDERTTHTDTVRHHLRVAMRALADGRYAMAGTWLVDLERINEQEANRAKAMTVQAHPCPDCDDCVRLPGHGRAA